MIDAGIAHPWPREVLEAVARFKQGDLVERPPFFYAATRSYGIWAFTRDSGDPNLESELFEVDLGDLLPYGLITTQTCDLDEQRLKPRQPWFTVAPVYQADDLLDPSQHAQVKRGAIGHLVLLEPPSLSSGLWVADLRIEVPLEKSWLVVHDPIEAFHNVVEVTPAPVGWFEDDGFGAVLVHADGSWTSDEE